MQCENCKAQVPVGKAVCPECKKLIRYNVEGFPRTKDVQSALKNLVSEQAERINDNDNLVGMIYDYLPDFDDERPVVLRAVRAGVLSCIIAAEDPKAEFKAQRERMTSLFRMSENEAELALASIGYMLGFAYPSPLMAEDKKPKKPEPVKKAPKELNFEEKVFGKLDGIKYRLSRNVSVKEGFTKLEGYCFEGFGFMRNIELPESLLMIGEYAFTDCKKLEDIEIPETVRKIEKGVFNACVSLKKVKLPEGILDIGDNSFFCCTALETLRIPDSVNSIGENAFEGCSSLKKLIVSKDVKFIDDNAFAYCPKLVVYCYENSYIHKYCMQNKIKYKTSAVGTALPAEEGEE